MSYNWRLNSGAYELDQVDSDYDPIVERVARREQEIDDSFGTEEVED